MATGATPLRDVKTLHTFRLKVVGGFGADLVQNVTAKVVCTDIQAQALKNIPVEAYFKSSYVTFTNAAYDVTVKGQDWEKTYAVFLQRLVESPLLSRSIKWNLVGVNEASS